MTPRRIRFAVAGLLAAWIVAATWLVPAVIHRVYAGGGPAVLGRLIGGRTQVPVAAYLRAWRHLALQSSFVLVTLLIIMSAVLWLVRLRRVQPAAVSPPGLPSVLWMCAWYGLMWGLGESYYMAWKAFVLGEIVSGFRYVSPDSLWMAPMVDVAIVAVVGTAGWAIGRLVRRPLTHRWLAFLAALLGLSSLILVTGRVSVIAGVLLAAGVAANLAPLAGAHAERFLVMARRTTPYLAATVVATVLLVTITPRVTERMAVSRLGAAPTGGAPNVIVIVLDTERAANMSLYGYPRPTTPFLERLASRGVVFDWAMAPANWTLPSHASMFTGRYPGELGTTFLKGLDDRFPTMAEVLRDRGYMTAGFAANVLFCIPFFGLNRGFVHFEAQPVSWQMALESSWLLRTAYRAGKVGEDRSGVRKDAGQITGHFLRWLGSRQNDRPYLAFLNYFDAHRPYVPPQAWLDRFASGSQGAPDYRGAAANLYTAQEMARIVDGYDGSIAWVDHELEVLFAELDRRGDLPGSLVIVTSDHGDEFGEHDSLGHAMGLNLPVLRVPLVLLHPSLTPGARITQPVTLRDLPATVMELTGMPQHPFPGSSWSRAWTRAVDAAPEPVFSEYGPRRSVLLGRWHYIVDRGEFLYDVVADPREQQSLMSSTDPALLTRLRSALDDFNAARN